MSWRRFLLCCVLSIPLALGLYVLADLAVAAKAEGQKGKPAPQRAATTVKPVKVATCYDCHSEIQEFHAKGKHAKVNCASCHDGLDKHLLDPSAKPVTKMEHVVCGGCHKDQYESFVAVNLASKAKQEKATLWTLATC
jgi:uncharacterized CHY-type Zn-finger protein